MDRTGKYIRQISRGYFMYMMSQFDAMPEQPEENAFKPAYDEAITFISAGLTPAFFVDLKADTIFVTTEEHINHKMH